MKETKTTRRRFEKPYHFLYKMEDSPLKLLSEVFKNFDLYELRKEINLWQQLALSNDQSAYDEGYEREDLIEFVQELHKLVEAFYIINARKYLETKNKNLKRLPKDIMKMLSRLDTTIFLTIEEEADPYIVVRRFCNTFKYSYINIEILDMLDAVVTYEGTKKVYKGNVVLFYQHIHFLVGLAYKMNKNRNK